MYSISTLSADLEAILHGTTTNKIVNLFGMYNRAGRQLLLDIDPQETKRTLQFTVPLFNSVTYYPIAPDVKGNAIIDIKPQVNRTGLDVYSQSYNQAFSLLSQNWGSLKSSFTMNFNSGIKTILINAPYLLPPISINQATSTTGNGTWTAGGTASALTNNSQNYVESLSSLQYNVGIGAGYVENSTMSSTDLSAHLNQSTLFLWAYFQTGSTVTDVKLRWGSSSANYYEVTATQTQQGTAFQNGWNLIAFPWNGATVVGTPNSAAINYLRVTYDVTGTQTGAGLNNVVSNLGTYMEYEYYSKYLFRDAVTGAFQETVTDVTNLINLDTETYNLFTNLVAVLAAQQTQGIDATYFDGEFFMNQYKQGVAEYKGRYKSEISKPQSLYYKKPNKAYQNVWIGWNGGSSN